MSLNGLDETAVKEAYDAASTEPGGWFLLKYASRDEINLLGRGNGGIVEIRNAIAQYEETSPLYGFLRYRRRNVIIKFLPADCSRLVQARVSVHFNAICEHFSPYDTTFEIAEAKELKDTKLSAACSLHAASGSTSSSTSSLRRRRLMEIAEEEEEEQRATKRQSVVQEEKTPSRPGSPSVPEVTLDSKLAESPDGTKFSSSGDIPTFVGAERPPSSAKTIEGEPRLSTQSARPEIFSSYSSYSSYGRPKVKLAPRPSMDSRPRTAGNYRPISALPAGFKIFSRKAKSKEQSGLEETIQEDTNDITFNATTIPIPETPPTPKAPELARPHTTGSAAAARPSTSSGVSVKSLKMISSASISAKDNKMTPEKARLIKAMQLREKKKRMAAVEAQQTPTLVEPVKEGPNPSEAAPEDAAATTTANLAGSSINGKRNAAPETIVLNAELANSLSMSKVDSGIAIDLASPSGTDLISEDTQTDSHPTSPMAETSEVGVSTKPSSLSDSTDETVEAHPKIDKMDKDEAEEQSIQASKPSSESKHIAEGKSDADTAVGLASEPEDSKAPTATADVDDSMNNAIVSPAATATTHQSEIAGGAEIAEETIEESNIDAPPTPVSPCTVALPVSKFAAKIPCVSEQGAEGMECNVAEFTTPDDESPASTPWKLPVSKFCTKEPAAGPSSSQLHILTSLAAAHAGELGGEARSEIVGLQVQEDAVSLSPATSSKKLSIDPVRTDLEVLEKDGHLSEDEDLMEELQSATLQRATHITVSKSPITPVFPTPAKGTSECDSPGLGINRTASNPTPLRGPLLAPSDVTQSTARSVSSGAAFLHKMAQQPPANSLAPKTGRIGSSISQRIKALEKLSAHNASSESLHPPSRHNVPSSTFFSVRKNSNGRESRSPSVFDKTSMLSPSSNASRDHSPEAHRGSPSRDRAASVASRMSMFEAPGSSPGHQSQMPSAPPSRGRTESIQVTARIVRDPAHPFPQMPEFRKDPADITPVELKESPLVVQKKSAEGPKVEVPAAPEILPTPDVPKETIQERRQSRDKRRSASTERGNESTLDRRSSLSIVKDFIKDRRNSIAKASDTNSLTAPSPNPTARSPSRPPSTHHNAFSPRRLSISSRRSSFSRENSGELLSPTSTTEASYSGDEKEKKSKNRASRFMRRLSASLSGNRKNMTPNISPTVREEDVSEVSVTAGQGSRTNSSTQQAIIAYIGEVNVQFPDNLLWKRRSMGLDGQGFLIISTIQGPSTEKHLGAGVKRYHLSEFRMPYIPDVEVQELPNSVVLDFVDGSGLQVACEDRAGQLNVLHTLQDAHQRHTSFGQ